MSNLLEIIRNKHKKQNKKPLSPKLKNKKYPKINIQKFDDNLKITFPSSSSYKKDKTEKKKKHNHPINMVNSRKKIKNELKVQLAKKRKNEMRKYRKQFGKEQIYYHSKKNKNKNEEKEEDEEEQEMEIEKEDKYEEDEDVDIIKEDDITEKEEEEYVSNIIENGDELDEEDLARMNLMRKSEVIPSELREFMDIAADEEDENGEIIKEKFNDEYEEKHGIAKNLLADKAENKLLKQYKEIYNTKRNEMHQQLMNKEDDKELELMKKAFIEGQYKKLKNKNRNNNMLSNGDDEEVDKFLFKSRNFELDRKNEPEYYLSENEEKNEYCCYDKNGLFNDIYTIRMKIMEWNRNNNVKRMKMVRS